MTVQQKRAKKWAKCAKRLRWRVLIGLDALFKQAARQASLPDADARAAWVSCHPARSRLEQLLTRACRLEQRS